MEAITEAIVLALLEEVTQPTLWMVVRAMDIILSIREVDIKLEPMVMAEAPSAMTQRNHLILL